MKLNLSEQVTNYDGKPLNKTYRDIILTCLNAIIIDEVITAEKKAQLYDLSKKLFKAEEVILSGHERQIILERAGKSLKSPLAYGRLVDFLKRK